MQFFSNYFRLEQNQTNWKTEIVAGVTTFMTMAYIIFVNPAILGDPKGAGMDYKGVMAATCIASGITTLLMAFIARYPIALAPGMGLNAFFSFYICGVLQVPWQIGLGIVLISGVCCTILTLLSVRQALIDAVPESLKLSAAVGIGLFIAFIGMKEAGLVKADPNTLVTLGNLTDKPTVLAIAGLVLTLGLLVRNVRGALLWGILGTGLIGLVGGLIKYEGIVSTPELTTVFGKLNVLGALETKPQQFGPVTLPIFVYLTPILVLVFFDMFDTIGTLIGLGEKAGFLKDGKLERATPALFSDAIGTVIGAICGTSNVTSYIESSAGISAGGRTGLANIVTALLFFAALFFSPLAHMLGGGYEVSPGAYLYPVTAPALIIVGFLMMSCITKIQWQDYTEAIPAFFTMILMPLTFSISYGLAIGFVVYAFVKLASGRYKDASWLVYGLALVFVAYFIWR